MKVIVTLAVAEKGKWDYEDGTGQAGYSDQHQISVRKCPPNYKIPYSNYLGLRQFICELGDYTDEDIKKYFS